MNSVIVTIIGAIILMGLVVALFSIGWIITGNIKLRRGGCGRVPQTKKDMKDKNSTCNICGSKQVCDEENDDEPKHS